METLVKVSELRKGARNELNKFYSKPVEVFRALREIAKDHESYVYMILSALDIKANKLSFDSFGRYAIYCAGRVLIHKPRKVEICGKKIEILEPIKFPTCKDYINVLLRLVADKQKAERKVQKARKAQLTKEERKKLARDKKRATIVAKIIASGKGKEEAEFLAALLVA